MKTQSIIVLMGLLGMGSALAFPPAPDHTIYGSVRDEQGRPLDTGEGTVIINGTAGEVKRTPTDSSRGVGVNYSAQIPMDSATVGTLFKTTALRPTMPFTMKVVIRGVNYVPMQMIGRTWSIGKPAARTRLDLTLGADSDNDGLPDSWEQNLIDSDPTGQILNLDSVRPEADLDKDGLSNLLEYQLGTYALDRLEGLTLEITEIKDGLAHLRFPVVAGRTYQVKSSPDLITWAVAGFKYSSQPEDKNTVNYLRATETTMLDVFVPVADAKTLKFSLHAQ